MDICIYRKSLFLDSLIVLYIVYHDFFKSCIILMELVEVLWRPIETSHGRGRLRRSMCEGNVDFSGETHH